METMGIGEDGEVKGSVGVAGEAMEAGGLAMETTEMVMMGVIKHRRVEVEARGGRGKGRERGRGRVEALTATVSEALLFHD